VKGALDFTACSNATTGLPSMKLPSSRTMGPARAGEDVDEDRPVLAVHAPGGRRDPDVVADEVELSVAHGPTFSTQRPSSPIT
jgi:hypothetical protein